jgi:hypothetical protein
MSQEQTIEVALPLDPELEKLIAEMEAAERRAEKSGPGERTDIVRYEVLRTSLEAHAAAALARDPTCARLARDPGAFTRDGDRFVVALAMPLEPGAKTDEPAVAEAPPPAERWPIRDDLWGRRLVEQRFREQLAAAIESPGGDRASALSPSGIHNRVLTEVLREQVERGDAEQVDVPVVYRDGSQARAPFPLRCLRLTEAEMVDSDLELRLALLSIRHTEMDPVVDGAWLRNADVSRPRPAGQTDDFVHEMSVDQLRALTEEGARRVRLRIFQTGLETAVVGFFRAVVEHLSVHPGTLEVVPMFYSPRRGGERTDGVAEDYAGFEPGAIWATAGDRG